MPLREKLTLGILVCITFFLMCDLYITPSILTELASEYQVSETQLSWVGSAFTLVGAIVGLYIGYKTDTSKRKKLLIITVLIGELPCLMTGIYFFTQTYEGFFLMRVFTGIGIGGIYPLTFSLVGDYFQAKHRAKASAFVDLAWSLGMMAGPLFGTMALNTEYGWRSAFIWAALPSFPLVLLFAWTAREPERGRNESALAEVVAEGAHYQYRAQLSDIKIIFANRSNVFCFLQGIPGSIPWGLFPFWLIVILGSTAGMTRENATWAWEIFGISVGASALAWAFLGDKLFAKNPAYLPALCTAGVFLGIIPMVMLFNFPDLPVALYFVLMVLAGLLISVPASNTKAILLNINRPEHRGSVFSFYNLADNIGKGVGPAMGGILLSMSGSYLAMANYAILFWVVCGAFFLGLTYSVNKDHQELSALMRNRASTL